MTGVRDGEQASGRDGPVECYAKGRADERAAIVAYLKRDPTVPDLVHEIEHGAHEDGGT